MILNVKDKPLYHFHKPYIESKEWGVGNELVIDDNYNSYFITQSIYNSGSGVINTANEIKPLMHYIERLLKEETKDTILALKNGSEEEYLKKMKFVRQILSDSNRVLHNFSIINRECGLEDYRKEHCKDYPSRFHSLWLCDDNSLEYWKHDFGDEAELYQMSVTGRVFVSSEFYLPNDGFTRGEAKESAQDYWFPKEDRDRSRDEYLFQGHVRILKKLQ